jgi:hypothetical protein
MHNKAAERALMIVWLDLARLLRIQAIDTGIFKLVIDGGI